MEKIHLVQHFQCTNDYNFSLVMPCPLYSVVQKWIILYLIANWLQLNYNNCNFVLVQIVSQLHKKFLFPGTWLAATAWSKWLCTCVPGLNSCKLYHWDFPVCIDKVVRTHRVVQQSECGLQCSQLLMYAEERMVLCICRCVIISNRSPLCWMLFV